MLGQIQAIGHQNFSKIKMQLTENETINPTEKSKKLQYGKNGVDKKNVKMEAEEVAVNF